MDEEPGYSSSSHDLLSANMEEVLAMIDASITAGDLGHAFSGYLLLLQDNRTCRDRIHDDFTTVLHQWAEQQEAAGRREEALWCYEVSRRLWPENAEIHNSMGVFLHKLGQEEEAASCFQLALEIDPGFTGAQKNLTNMVSSPFLGWHFPMLNDKRRNLGYQTAIAKAVSCGHDRVLDIGSGTGLLSMFAVNAGAISVHACEESREMLKLSQDILTANEMQGRVHLLHKLSTDMAVSDDIPNRVSLVVTEIFDAGLFGEGAVTTLQHAWKHLLLPPKTSSPQTPGSYGRVIPARATVYAQVVQCQHVRKQYRLSSETICNLDMRTGKIGSKCQMSGFQEECSNSESPTEPPSSGDQAMAQRTGPQRHLGGSKEEPHSNMGCRKPISNIEDQRSLKVSRGEPYTSERLQEVPLSYQALTPAIKVLEVNFENPQILTADHPTSDWKHIDFPVTGSGQVDAILSWFELILDETQTLSSSPDSGSCWEQAVFPVTPRNYSPPGLRGDFEEDLCVRKCDNISVAVSCQDECLHLRCEKITHQAVSKMEVSPTSAPAVTHDEDMDHMVTSFERNLVTSSDSPERTQKENGAGVSDIDIQALYMFDMWESDTIAVLNDHKLHSACYSAIKTIISESRLQASKDSSSGKPGVLMKQQSTSSHSSKTSSRPSQFSVLDLSSCVSLTGLFAAKYCPSTRVCLPNSQPKVRSLIKTIATTNRMEDCVDFRAEPHPLSPSSEAAWDVLVADLVAPCGTLRERVLEDIAVGRVCALKPTGRVLPATVNVFAMCIECSSLQRDSAVLGTDSTMGLKIHDLINKYKVSTFLDIHLSARAYKQLSRPFLAFHLDFNETPNPETADLPSFVNQTTTNEFEATDDGKITAVPFWYDIGLDPSNHVNTLDNETHWRQAAVLLPEGKSVRKGDQVKVTARIEDSSFLFTVELKR
ncbi:protein arginine N-methyltransferase 9-like [Acanthaster planci]|uniref:Protein arginine N-methyltransferase 9-like n=1 Tax=Acanthaster planci TaxID=133434 RepID=A0A8B7XZU9_ACAPL|nr:protein arginine N-methyltransferase 9-like [Acanthaster planci]XP_022086435.1 protein arginine N-methyltransferase 9-like [Acanthaster planci]